MLKIGKISFFLLCLLNFYTGAKAQKKSIILFNSKDVKLLPSVFKNAEETDLNYILALNPDRLLAPYLYESGLKPKAENYPNWENTGLNGHTGGHYLSALSLMFAATGDKRLKQRLNYMLDELKKCQDKNGNGYVGGVPDGNVFWDIIAQGGKNIGSELNKKWVPFYNIHKVYAGLRDAYLYTGSFKAKAMLVAYSNWLIWLTKKLSDQQIQLLLKTEHGGINEVLVDVYQITGEKKYLDLAYRFSDQRILTPLTKQLDLLNGLHANTQIPKIIGFKRIADLNNDSLYQAAAHFFWKTVVDNRTVALGGNSVREHFNASSDFSSMMTSIEGPETCNSYNMLKLTKMLYQSDGLLSYIDYYERTLYNHILSSQHPEKGGFVYFTPMRPGHFRVYSQPQTSFWCCVGTGMENHAKYNELIYAAKENELFVNLFIPSILNWRSKGVVLTQRTNFPESENTFFTIKTIKKTKFKLQFRYPKWVKEGFLKIFVNGVPFKFKSSGGKYITIDRFWKTGDKIAVYLPMHTSTEQLPNGSNFVAVMHGPILLAAKTDTTNMPGLFANEARMAHIANGKLIPLQYMPLFLKKEMGFTAAIHQVANQNLTFTAQEIIYPEKYKNLLLVPFYKIHDSRYIIYWQTETLKGLDSLQQKLAKERAEEEQLAQKTVDLIFPGEQQSESDHFIQSENSTTGINNNRHWRAAKGWFTYKLVNLKEAGKLRITYYGRDINRDFSIFFNNKPIALVKLATSKGDQFYTVDYQIPLLSAYVIDQQIPLKFIANNTSETAGIYEIRILKE